MTITKIIPIDAQNSISFALKEMQKGEVIAIPTDTVYGIACLISIPSAIEQIYTIKGRASNKAIPILIGEIEQLTLIAKELSPSAKKLTQNFWPGALTLIVKRRSELPTQLSPYPTVGVRMPNHVWLQHLIAQSGPIAATSANLSGQAEATTAGEVLNQLKGRITLLIDGGVCKGGIPSTVVDCSGVEIKILREGAIQSQMILNSLR